MPVFRCDICDYTTSIKCNYDKHLLTDKHRSHKSINVQKNVHFSMPHAAPQIPCTIHEKAPFVCLACGRKYTAQRSLWRHSKRCNCANDEETIHDTSMYDKFTTTVTELCKSNAELSKMNQLQQTQIHEMYNYFVSSLHNQKVLNSPHSQSIQPQNYIVSAPVENPIGGQINTQPTTITNNLHSVTVNGNVTNNSNNKTFNINMFLNEECKDAMNMADFVKTIELDTDDMEDVGKYGFVKGISKIFIDNLEKTEVGKRPIHCSDSKREVLYIKDDNKWEREGIHSKKLINAIHTVEHKNVILVNEWAKLHPLCEKSETQANQIYMTLSKHAHDGDDDNITKVAKRIAKTVVIDKMAD
jgi:hypothetical protein